MILNDKQIRSLCNPPHLGDGTMAGEPEWQPMIHPFVEKLEQKGVISYGLTSFGYDIRCGDKWKLFTDIHSEIVDPKKPSSYCFHDRTVPFGDFIIIPPNSYALTHSHEYVRMPANLMGLCIGKSTYARCGIHVNITPIEAGWEGQITIEISNSTRLPVKVYSGEGIMQLLFFRGERPAVTYADRQGKYQNQTGVTIAKVVE